MKPILNRENTKNQNLVFPVVLRQVAFQKSGRFHNFMLI